MNLENLTEICKDEYLWDKLLIDALKKLKGSLEFARKRPAEVEKILAELESPELEDWVNNLNANPAKLKPYEVTLNAMKTINSYFRLEA